MASAGARAYNGGLGAEPPAGVQRAEPPVGVRGRSPLQPTRFLVFKTVIFNASGTVLHEMMYCLSWFFCAQIYGFTVRICSLAIAHQHFSIIWQVLNKVVLRVDRSAQGKNRTYPTPSPSPSLPPSRPLPFPSSPSPLEVGPWNPPRRSGERSNLVHYSIKIRHLVATILIIFLRVNWPFRAL